MMLYNSDVLLPFTKIVVAYSGGMDSHCLLHMLANDERFRSKLYAVHVNHGLSPNAEQWKIHCETVCCELNIPLQVIMLDIPMRRGVSLEAAARDARYAAFAHLIDSNEALVTAHHLDDQAETVLLQLFRGAGVKGLAAMPLIKKFSRGSHLRPLLAVSRDALCSYARQQRLSWVEDESNQDEGFARNYLRQKILPLLTPHWKNVSNTIARSGEHCAQAAELLQELAQLDLQSCRIEANILSIKPLMNLSTARQINVLRHWCEQQSGKLPSTINIRRVLSEVIGAREDAQPEIIWQNKKIRRFNDRLYFIVAKPDSNPKEYLWDWQTSPLQYGDATIRAISSIGEGLAIEKLPQTLMVRCRRGGEKIKPYGRKETHKLKHLFQEWQIPSWERDEIPLVFAAERLIAVLGYCYANEFIAVAGEVSIIFDSHQDNE